MRIANLISYGVALTLILAGRLEAGSFTITDLGVLPGGTSVIPAGMNAGGQVTGQGQISGGATRAFLWSGGSLQDLGTLGSYSTGNAVNQSGSVVGSTTIPGGAEHAYLWDGVMHDLGTLGGTTSFAEGINSTGWVVGGSYVAGNNLIHAFLWNGTSMVDLAPAGGFSRAQGINDSGVITGYFDLPNNGPTHAFLWSGGVMQDLGALPGNSSSTGNAINASGQVAGNSFTPGNPLTQGFSWNGSTMVGIGSLGGATRAMALNDLGWVTGDSETASHALHAFLWDGMSMQDLNSLVSNGAGWTLIQGTGINDAGQITGYGTFGSEVHGFLLTPARGAQTPEPNSFVLLGIGAGLCVFRFLRQR